MAGGTRIVSIDGERSETGETANEFASTGEVTADDAPLDDQEHWADEPTLARQSLLWPGLAILTIAAWTTVFSWARLPEILAGPTLVQSTALIADWATPVLLVCVIWLLAMRMSRTEAIRFGDAARLLASESAHVEARMTTINRELSLAREFLAAQARDLDAMGRVAVDRLSQNADRLQQLVVDNSARVDAIGDVSLVALENMEKLRGQLPVISSSAKDVTNHIANAGRTAHSQIQEMIDGFMRINEFGQASERQVDTLSGRIDTALSAYEARCEELDRNVGARFDAFAQNSDAFRTQLDEHEVAALASVRTRAGAMSEEIETLRAGLDRNEEEALTSLRSRLAGLRDEGATLSRSIRDGEARATEEWSAAIARTDAGMRTAFAALDDDSDRRRTSHQAEFDAIVARNAELTGHLASFEERLEGFASHLQTIESSLGGNLGELSNRLVAGRHEIESADRMLGDLTEASVRLLELIRASTQHSRDELPQALQLGEDRLSAYCLQIDRLSETVIETADRGESLSGRLSEARQVAVGLGHEIEAAEARLGSVSQTHQAALSDLGERLEALANRNEQLTDRARGELASAIGELNSAREVALARLAEAGATGVSDIARKLQVESSSAIIAALHESIGGATGEIETAAEQAAAAGKQAAVQLRDQLAMVNELAGNLERRVAHARTRAEEQVDNEFSRRAALITESLNSNAIDIAKALSADVADTAWAAYLRGDRGIFTRRAVALLENAEARSIVQIYENDAGFRDHVSRYIHDFEAILRQVLSTRDGNALGVALLSSDMGKLYVALAQAIERLRK